MEHIHQFRLNSKTIEYRKSILQTFSRIILKQGLFFQERLYEISAWVINQQTIFRITIQNHYFIKCSSCL